MIMKLRLLIILSLLHYSLFAQIAAGPMLGYAEMTETMIWIQTSKAGEVELKYWPADDSKSVKSVSSKSIASNELVNKLILPHLEPGKTYHYQVLFDKKSVEFPYPLQFNTLPLWQHRTDAPDFTFATGSCNYINEERFDRPGRAFGSDSEIFNAIADKKPNLMLWLGDNTYFREPDWNTWNGIVHRYNHTRSHPKMQRLLATCNNYAIWDDHDFGPNDANGSFVHKELTLDAFKLYWANPSYGLPHLPSIISQFRYNDADFFLLDNRYYRTASDLKTSDPQILGSEQIEWLIQALKYSKASFKFVAVGGQFLNTAKVYENHANYDKERTEIIRRLKEEDIQNVIFLTGDRHHSELSKFEEDGFVIYDLTVSPLTSGAFANEEENLLRVEGTKHTDRNFATLSLTGDKQNRLLTIQLFKESGELIWKQAITRAPKR
jgi:alkaline phosphatase D